MRHRAVRPEPSGSEQGLPVVLPDFLTSCLPHLSNISYRLGRELKFDGAREKFVNDAEADAMLTRKYREQFVVPQKV